MLKKKKGRPPKKKVIDSFRKEDVVEVPEVLKEESPNEASCDCGELAVPGQTQCWNCAHRA